MNASHRILGCAVAALLVAPSAFAGDLTTQDLVGAQRTSGSTATAQTTDSTADLNVFTRNGDTSQSGADTGSDSNSMPTSTSSRHATSHHSSVGWQSLLPGSIQ